MKESKGETTRTLELGKSKKPQIFTDETGKRWRYLRVLLSFGLIIFLIFGFFGVESNLRSIRSYLSLEAGTETNGLVSYPVMLDLDSDDYPHFKEYIYNFSEVLIEGRTSSPENNLLEFKQKYIPDVPQVLVEPVNSALLGNLINSETNQEYFGALKFYLRAYDYTGLAMSVTDLDGVSLEYLAQQFSNELGTEFTFDWIFDGAIVSSIPTEYLDNSYQLIKLNNLESGEVIDYEAATPLFQFEYQNSETVSISAAEFQTTFFQDQLCIYDVIGFCDTYKMLDSLVVYDQLQRSNYQGEFGFAGLSEVDSRAWMIEDYEPGGGIEEVYLSTSISRQGGGQMYHLIEEGRPLEVEVLRKDDILTAKVAQTPVQAKVVRFGQRSDHINLSFDDGPHPEYTPAILDILKEKNVKATFHVVGVNVRKHPDIVKRIVDEGHEIGNHTYLHPRTYYLRPDAFEKEVLLTQDAIREIAGTTPRYFRTPFNDTDGYETNYDLKNLKVLQDMGLQVSEFEVDSQDWTRPGVNAIQNNVMDQIKTGEYSQVLFHDGGGDKSQTIEALPGVIDAIRSRGIEFVLLDELNHHHAFAPQEQSRLWNLRNTIKTWNVKYLSKAFWGYTTFFAWIMFAKLFVTLFLFGLTLLRKRRFTDSQPGVSVIVPAYNEEKTILDTVKSVLSSDYPKFEVVVINDGSKDNTLIKLQKKYGKHKKVTILDKKNGGKSSASNHGILAAKYDYVVCIDADTIMLPDTIAKLMRNFIKPNIAGVSGNIHVGNYESFLTQTQRAEYIYGQSFDKEIFSLVNAIPVVPGALGVWKKDLVIEVGGYSNETLAEDTDLTLRIRKLGKKIVYERDAIAITEAPSSIRDFFKQRVRWQYGTLQCLWKHKNIILNPRYGYLGLVVLPEILLSFMFLGMMIAYLYMIILLLSNFTIAFFSSRADIQSLLGGDLTRSLTFVAASLALYYLSNVMAVLVDNNKNKWQVLWYLPYQMIVYRALLWFTQCLVVLKAIKGGAQSWNHLNRTGLKRQLISRNPSTEK